MTKGSPAEYDVPITMTGIVTSLLVIYRYACALHRLQVDSPRPSTDQPVTRWYRE